MKLKKLLMIAIVFVLALSSLVSVTGEAKAATAFKDVPTSHANYKEIMNLVDRGVVGGFTDGTFKPTKQVTRAEFAAFVARALNLPAATSNFKDVSKSAALYDGVSRANKAGIILGFKDNTFKPNTPVSRQDMAAMLDRAMQLKGSYTKTKALDFADASKVGAYAKTSIQRMYNYNVMSAYSGKNFAPTTIGTRAETVKAIHNMLTVVEGGAIVEPTPPTGNVTHKQDTRKYTLAELRKILPPTTVMERGGDGSVIVTDMVKAYYDEVQKPGYVGYNIQPKQSMESLIVLLKDSHQKYQRAFPKYELIAFNGVPYRNSEIFPSFLLNASSVSDHELNNMIAAPPAASGEFLIDASIFNSDIVTYAKDNIKVSKAKKNPKVVNKDFVIDLKAVFKDAPSVNVSSDGLTVSYLDNSLKLKSGSNKATLNGKEVTLSSAVSVESGTVMAPVQSVSTLIGLNVRKRDQYRGTGKIEIANYELPVLELNNGSIVSYKGYGWER